MFIHLTFMLGYLDMKIQVYVHDQVEEMNSDQVEKHALPYVLVLHAFCLVDPTLCAPASNPSQFVVTLQPYLKTQVKTNLKSCILAYSSIIMNCVTVDLMFLILH